MQKYKSKAFCPVNPRYIKLALYCTYYDFDVFLQDAFAGGQMQMGMMENSGMPQPNQMPQQNQMGQSNQMSQPPDQFPQPYPQQFQNRQEFARNQFYGQDNPGFGNNGIRPEGFNQPFPQSPSPQVNVWRFFL